jgi:hypothetical protein
MTAIRFAIAEFLVRPEGLFYLLVIAERIFS